MGILPFDPWGSLQYFPYSIDFSQFRRLISYGMLTGRTNMTHNFGTPGSTLAIL